MSLVPLAPFLNSLGMTGLARPRPTIYAVRPQQFLYFFPLPHGHGSLRPTFGSSRRTVLGVASSPPTRGGCCARGGPNGLACAARARLPPTTDCNSDADGSFRISGGDRRAGRRGGGGPVGSLRIGRSHQR